MISETEVLRAYLDADKRDPPRSRMFSGPFTEAAVRPLFDLVDRLAALNPAAGEIGAGMLAQLVGEARRLQGGVHGDR